MSNCEHRSAVYGCASCVKRVRGEMPEFPVQTQRDVKPGPLSIPWAIAERAWLSYQAQYGTQQSVERMAQRGGFGWGELDMFAPGWREEVDRWRRVTAELAAAQKRIAELEKEAEYRRNVAREDDALYRQRMERIAELEAELEEVRFSTERNFVARADFEKALEERESAMAERNFAREDQEAAQKRIAELEQKNAELDEAVRVNAEARLNSHRFRDLEAQVAQHPEQLQETARRVAEAVQLALISRFPCEWRPPTDTCLGCAIRSELRPPPHVAAIIAEATKP